MKKPALLIALSLTLFVAFGAFAADKASRPEGEEKTSKTKALETGAGLLQAQKPLESLNVYLDGFHFHNGDIRRQVEAHHFCAQVNEDFIQCVIYDGNTRDALLMGVEYVISRKLFDTLPQNERKMWHSHAYEVKSGMLAAPGIPEPAEHELMEKLASTYGKTWHTWNMEHLDRGLPFGIPELMMGFTAEGQIDPIIVQERDKDLGINTEAKRKSRQDIRPPEVLPGADAWQAGEVMQLKLEPVR